MTNVLTDRTLPLAVAQVLVRIDGIESGIAASIDRFADTVGAELCNAIEPKSGIRKAAHENTSPYRDNGSVAA
jgi:hypothetical protein